MKEVLVAKNISYKYSDGQKDKVILDNASISFDKGKFYAIFGESGSGKTTFLSMLGGLDNRYSGHIYFEGKDINEIGLERYRRNMVSFIFQDYNLISYMTVYDNLASAISISKSNYGKKDIVDIINKIGMDDSILNKRVSKLSGGEKQRVAIARSVLMDSKIILADEPTGNLDKKTAWEIIDLFRSLAKDFNKTIIMVTHNEAYFDYVDESYYLDQDLKRFIAYEH